MTRYAYPAARDVMARLTDVVLVAVSLGLAVTDAFGRLGATLAIAIPLVLVWGIATLHYPRAVTLDDEGITFEGWGRRHRFAWSEVESLKLRRFLTGDRVLVRLSPTPPLRGRYWLLDSMTDYQALLAELERRVTPRGASSTASRGPARPPR